MKPGRNALVERKKTTEVIFVDGRILELASERGVERIQIPVALPERLVVIERDYSDLEAQMKKFAHELREIAVSYLD
jgi:hypothetical protein